MYKEGKGVIKDYSRAAEWFKRSASFGYDNAQYNLGVMYMEGYGFNKNFTEAQKLFIQAAKQGHPYAQNNLGTFYQYGFGVTKNSTKSHMWYNIALANGIAKSSKHRDELEDLMSAKEISKATAMARECMESDYKKCGDSDEIVEGTQELFDFDSFSDVIEDTGVPTDGMAKESVMEDKSKSYTISVTYSLGSLNIPYILDDEAEEKYNLIVSDLKTYSTELECIKALSNPDIQMQFLSSMADTPISDIVLRCKAYWSIENCKPNILIGEFCNGEADIGSPIRLINYVGTVTSGEKEYIQIIPPELRMKDISHTILRSTSYGNFDVGLKPFLVSSKIYKPNSLFPITKNSNLSCETAIEKAAPIMKKINMFKQAPTIKKFRFECIYVDRNGKVTITKSKSILTK
jgi:hypothetical protein